MELQSYRATNAVTHQTIAGSMVSYFVYPVYPGGAVVCRVLSKLRLLAPSGA